MEASLTTNAVTAYPKTNTGSQSDDTTSECQLLALAPELRHTIYDVAFTSDHDELDAVDIVYGYAAPRTALLRSCRQICHEAAGLYKEAQRPYWSTTRFVLMQEVKYTSDPPLPCDKALALVRHITLHTSTHWVVEPLTDGRSAADFVDAEFSVAGMIWRSSMAMQRDSEGRWVWKYGVIDDERRYCILKMDHDFGMYEVSFGDTEIVEAVGPRLPITRFELEVLLGTCELQDDSDADSEDGDDCWFKVAW